MHDLLARRLWLHAHAAAGKRRVGGRGGAACRGPRPAGRPNPGTSGCPCSCARSRAAPMRRGQRRRFCRSLGQAPARLTPLASAYPVLSARPSAPAIHT